MVRPFYYQGKLCGLAGEHWPLAGYRWAGAGRLLLAGDRDPAGGAATAASEALPARGIDRDILDIVLAQHPGAGGAHRRHPGPGRRAGDRRSAADGVARPLRSRDVEAAHRRTEERSEQQMRAHIATIPDGIYPFRCCMDSDGVVNEPVWIDSGTHGGGQRPTSISREQPTLTRAGQLGLGQYSLGGLRGDQARIPGRADQRRLFRAAAHP